MNLRAQSPGFRSSMDTEERNPKRAVQAHPLAKLLDGVREFPQRFVEETKFFLSLVADLISENQNVSVGRRRRRVGCPSIERVHNRDSARNHHPPSFLRRSVSEAITDSIDGRGRTT
jgi:hypothetical protein